MESRVNRELANGTFPTLTGFVRWCEETGRGREHHVPSTSTKYRATSTGAYLGIHFGKDLVAKHATITRQVAGIRRELPSLSRPGDLGGVGRSVNRLGISPPNDCAVRSQSGGRTDRRRTGAVDHRSATQLESSPECGPPDSCIAYPRVDRRTLKSAGLIAVLRIL